MYVTSMKEEPIELIPLRVQVPRLGILRAAIDHQLNGKPRVLSISARRPSGSQMNKKKSENECTRLHGKAIFDPNEAK